MTTSAPRTMSELMDRAVRSMGRDLRVAMPGRVVKYDAATQKADVQPTVQELVLEEDGTRSPETLPVITSVPVLFPGGGGHRLTFPVAAGDYVLLVFTDRSLDVWLDEGGVVNPLDVRQHFISDAVAIPGLHPFSEPWSGASEDGSTLGADGGPQVSISNSEIKLGVDATEAVVRGTTWRTNETALHAALSAGLTALGSAALGVIPPYAGLAIQAAALGMVTAIQQYETQATLPANPVLSTLTKTE